VLIWRVETKGVDQTQREKVAIMNQSCQNIFTVGHSSLDEDALLRLLTAQGLLAVADVRSVPASGRHPQFNRRGFQPFLEKAGFRYLWLGRELGGLREGITYQEHMRSDTFITGLETLERFAREQPTAILCAERFHTDCHRQHIADALVRNGWQVVHITGEAKTEKHQLQESLFDG
jgi:uncharacterized protein (DUF488 family)